MNLSAPFIQRPVMTTFLMLTILVAGWMAFIKLPVSDLPTIEHPHIQVSTNYTGANSETVMNQVTIPLEKELSHVKGLQEMSSKSSSGHSSISLTFDFSKNMDEAVRDVQAAINRAEDHLPNEINERPSYDLQENSQEPIMFLLLTSDNSIAGGDLRNYAEAYIIPRLSRIDGVAQVMTFGTEKSIWLRLNPEIMAARQIGFNQVIDTIKQHTTQMPLGGIQTSNKMLVIELSGSLKEAEELENLKITNTEIRLKDIGEVSDKSDHDPEFRFVTPELSVPALILGIQKINNGNTVAISKSVQATLAVLKKELPSSIHLDLWFDKAVWIEESIFDVEWSLLFAFALVVLVIYFSLGRISEALITSVALPLSLIGTFIVMYLSDFSLNLLSLLALTLSVGFVVDDAIVVLENIVRHQEGGAPPYKASLSGSKQISFTILSMTISLVAVFIPLLFMEGISGRLFREFSITLAVAILVSGFISLTLIPMLCSKFLPAHKSRTNIQNTIARINANMSELYGRTLKKSFRFPKTILSFALLCVIGTVYLFTKLPVSLIPPEDRGFLIAHVRLPSGTAAAPTKEYQQKLEAIFKTNPHIKHFLDINWEGNLIFIINLHSLPQRPPQPVVIAELQKAIDAIPGTQTFIHGYQLIDLDFGFGDAGQYKYVIRGIELEDVEIAGNRLIKAIQTNPAFTFAMNSNQEDSPKLLVSINEEMVHKLGLSKQSIQTLLQQAYGQNSVGVIQKGATQEKIFLELQPEFQNHAGSLAKLYLSAANGSLIPFKALAEWEEKLGLPKLVRREQLPSATIRFSLSDSISPNDGLRKLEEIAAEVMPSTVHGELDGSANLIASTIRNTLLLLLAAAVVMYIVLGILYESFIHPLTILSSLPFAGLGGVLTLFLFGEPISIFSAVGFLLLIGIVKKNGIMMIDYAIEVQKQGKSSEASIYEGCLARFRPIMMTTIAAIMGAVPIAIGFGEGAEMRRGLGLVIVGGLLFSQFLTLYVTPILYLTFEKLRRHSRTTDQATA